MENLISIGIDAVKFVGSAFVCGALLAYAGPFGGKKNARGGVIAVVLAVTIAFVTMFVWKFGL